jgi:hypothetical protein
MSTITNMAMMQISEVQLNPLTFLERNSTYSAYSPRKHLKTLFCNCVLKLILTLLEYDDVNYALEIKFHHQPIF